MPGSIFRPVMPVQLELSRWRPWPFPILALAAMGLGALWREKTPKWIRLLRIADGRGVSFRGGGRRGICFLQRRTQRQYGAGNFSREVGNGQNRDFAQRNFFSPLNAGEFFHVDAKGLHCYFSVRYRVPNFVRPHETKTAIPALHWQLSQMAAQFRDCVSVHGDHWKMPQIGGERRKVIGRCFRVSFFGRRKKQRTASLVRKDSRGQADLHPRAFLGPFRQKICDAEFPAFTKLRNGAEQALRRFWRAKSSAQVHHRLVPVAGRFRLKISVRAPLELLPARRFAEMSANGSQTRENTSHVAIQHSLFLLKRNAENGRGGVIPNSRQGQQVFQARRNLPSMLADDPLRRFVQIPRAAVIT